VISAGIADVDWQWADAFREAYRRMYGRYPRVDVWNVHSYSLAPGTSQVDETVFRSRLVEFRAWMDRAGEGRHALMVGEFGVLLGADAGSADHVSPEALVAYIQSTTAWLETSDHVQAWAWFGNHTSGLYHGDLYDAQEQLTPYGEAYRDAIAN
jgi:hypothetical protein